MYYLELSSTWWNIEWNKNQIQMGERYLYHITASQPIKTIKINASTVIGLRYKLELN